MEERIITPALLRRFAQYLVQEEKSAATQKKYLRDVEAFAAFAEKRQVNKELVIDYKGACMERGYAVRSINSMLASINSLLGFAGWHECRVKNIRLQRQIYSAENTELSKREYLRLLECARGNERLSLILQTICATGIRVSELQYFTLEAVRTGSITVSCKNKTRTILVPGKLKKRLMAYARQNRIKSGTIFCGRTGKPLNRSMIWRQIKQLCAAAGVPQSKGFPHNLRKLFARTFYAMEGDIAKLADILGHSSINTTRIYIMSTGTEHRRIIERLGLVI